LSAANYFTTISKDNAEQHNPNSKDDGDNDSIDSRSAPKSEKFL
jgi:hypothetical protein